MNFEEEQNQLILSVSVLWRVACEYASDELYEEVQSLMGNAIMAESEEELEAVSNKMPHVFAQLDLSTEKKMREMEAMWKHAMSAESLKILRVKAGLTQSQLAKKIGTTQTSIARYESDVNNLRKASYETLLNLAESLGVEIRDISLYKKSI